MANEMEIPPEVAEWLDGEDAVMLRKSDWDEVRELVRAAFPDRLPPMMVVPLSVSRAGRS